MTRMIDAAGVYEVSEGEYLADPMAHKGGSLSSTEARLLLESPAKFRWRREHGQEHSEDFDFGKAAHSVLLGVGAKFDVVEADDWRSKDARAARDASRAAGRVPMLAKQLPVVQAMVEAVRAHPIAGPLFDLEHGDAERTIVWPDKRTGVWRRARPDLLPHVPESGRLIVPEYKTTQHAGRRAFGHTVANFGYHQQAEWYLDGVRTVLGVTDPALVFVAQEKWPPYLVNVLELDRYAMTIGRERNRRAIDVYVSCVESGQWPGYGDEVQQASLPRWAEIQHEEDMQSEH